MSLFVRLVFDIDANVCAARLCCQANLAKEVLGESPGNAVLEQRNPISKDALNQSSKDVPNQSHIEQSSPISKDAPNHSHMEQSNPISKDAPNQSHIKKKPSISKDAPNEQVQDRLICLQFLQEPFTLNPCWCQASM